MDVMRVEAVHGDITLERVDAIVNAANSSLLGGGGVDGAIHAAAGPELLEACREVRRTRYPDGLPVGDAVVTPAFRLPARWVVHTVGPDRHRGETSPALLASCFARSLDVAVEAGASSVAFPAVSGGVYGWDMTEVARVAVTTVRTWAAGTGEPEDRGPGRSPSPSPGPGPAGIDLVRFVLFSPGALRTFQAALTAHP